MNKYVEYKKKEIDGQLLMDDTFYYLMVPAGTHPGLTADPFLYFLFYFFRFVAIVV
jgi:hypothetical protein